MQTVTNTPDLVQVPLTTQSDTVTRGPRPRYYEDRFKIYDRLAPSGKFPKPIITINGDLPLHLVEAVVKALNAANPVKPSRHLGLGDLTGS